MVPWNKRFLWKPSFLGSMLNLGSVYTSSTRSVVKRVVPGADHLSPAARVWPAAKSTPPVTWPRFRSRFRTEGETFLFQKKRHVFVGLEVWKSVFFLVTWLEFGNFNLKYLDMIYIYIRIYVCYWECHGKKREYVYRHHIFWDPEKITSFGRIQINGNGMGTVVT